MSGYFARLTSLIRAPGSSTTSAKASIGPVPLEQSIEADAAPPTATVAESADAPVSFAPQNPARPLIQPSNVQAGMPSARSAQAISAAEPAAAARTSMSSPARALHATTAPASPRDSTPSPRQAGAPATDAQSPPELRARHAAPHFAPASDLPASSDGRASDWLTSPATMPGQQASPVTAHRPQPSAGVAAAGSGNAWSGAPRSQAGLPEAPTPSTAAAAAPRTEIHIGTIALEVRTAAPATVAAAPQPAADPSRPTPASPFSPHRHYLRWS